MGLFNDNVNANRTSWNYKYTGKDLLDPARKLLVFHSTKEMEARNKTADLMRDDKVGQNDPRFGELKRDLSHHGTMKEQLQVFVHEFNRNPEKEYTLGLGDVTFFELTSKN